MKLICAKIVVILIYCFSVLSLCSSSICVTMAEQVKGQRDYEKAIKFYKEALVYNENDSKVMIPMTRKFDSFK